MKQKITEIKFENKTIFGSDFDMVSLQDVLQRQPANHSQYELHKVSFYVILLLTNGKGKYNLNFKDYKFKKGALFTVRKDNIHKFYKSNAQGTLLLFTKDFIIDHSNKLESSKILMLFNEALSVPKLQLDEHDFNEITTLIDQAKHEYLQINDIHSKVILRSLIQIIFTKLYRIKSSDNPLFEKNKFLSTFLTFQTAVERLCFENRKVAFYAEKMGVSTKTLTNATQSIVNKTAKAFINEIFIIHVKRLIINSKDSLIKISYKAGFDEPTNFFKYFKKQTGISPSEFRNQL